MSQKKHPTQLLLLQHIENETHINPHHLEAAISDGEGVTLYFTSGLEIVVSQKCFVDLYHQLRGVERTTIS